MSETLRMDGKAVEITLTEVTSKGTPVLYDGFHGITMQAGSSGDVVAIEIAQRVHEITVGAGVTGAKGDTLYIATDGTVDNTDTERAYMKVVRAKDSNNVVWGLQLPQGAESV